MHYQMNKQSSAAVLLSQQIRQQACAVPEIQDICADLCDRLSAQAPGHSQLLLPMQEHHIVLQHCVVAHMCGPLRHNLCTGKHTPCHTTRLVQSAVHATCMHATCICLFEKCSASHIGMSAAPDLSAACDRTLMIHINSRSGLPVLVC